MSDPAPIHVLHLASGDLWAGAEVQLFTLARALHQHPDIRLTVVLFNHGELEQRLKQAAIDVVVLDESVLPSYRLFAQLIRLFRRIRPDIVHTHRLKENILGSFAGLLGHRPKSLRTTHGASEHAVAWWDMPGRVIEFLDRLSGRYFQDCVIAVSDELAALLRRQFSPDKVHVVLNGIDSEMLLAAAETDSPFADGDKNTLRIGLVGRLVAVKRPDLFIEIAQQVKQLCPSRDFRFHIIGDGPLRNTMEALGRETGAGSLVAFEGHCSNVQDYVRHLDILLMCSDHEGLPMVLLEAMALGTPIIAHAVGGITRLLDNGDAGVLVGTQSATAYAKEIIALADNPGRRRQLSKAAAARVAGVYSAAHNADQVITLYKQLLAQ